MKKKYLPLYEKWMEHGLDGHDGLCRAFKSNSIGYGTLDRYFFTKREADYYADKFIEDAPGQFTPLRQNIVLLLAAMNNEL